MPSYLMLASYWPKEYLYWPTTYWASGPFTGMIDVTLMPRSLTMTVEDD